MASGTLVKVRAAGGHLIHLLLVNGVNRTSLCGHTPTNGRGRKIRRARWIKVFNQEYPVTCKKCHAKDQSNPSARDDADGR